jgi:hypothetical protein
MFIQIFRNRILRSRDLRVKIEGIESVIRANYHVNEPDIVSAIVNEWNNKPIIDLGQFQVNGNQYHLWLEFAHKMTHGKLLTVDIKLDENEWMKNIEYKTESGDLALIVEYYLEDTLLSSRLSLLQTKKEMRQDETKISLHQLYLMQFWPSVRFGGQTFNFVNVTPEDFSFYHFILSNSKPPNCSSTVCSSTLVYTKLGLTESLLINQLRKWNLKRKSGAKSKAPPALPFNGLLSGAVDGVNIRGNNWSKVPKPFGRFLREAAYLFVGSPRKEIRMLAESVVPNIDILYLRARASRERRRE